MPQRLPLKLWIGPAVVVGLLAGAISLLASTNPLLGLVVIVGLVGLTALVLGWPFSGVAILIVAALFTRYRFDVGPITVRFEHIAVLAVGAMAAMQQMVHRGRIRFPLAAWFALAWWLMNLIAALFFSPYAPTAVQNATRLALLVLTFVLIVNLIPNRQHWWWAVGLFVIAGVIEAAFGVTARALFPFGINLGVQVSWSFTEPIPYGTFEEGNLFGSHIASWALLLSMLILATGLWKPTRQQFWRLAGLAILLLGLFLSLSRAAWLTFVAGAALLFIFYRKNSWHQINIGLLIILVAPFTILLLLIIAPFLPASWPFVDRLQSFLTLSTDDTFSARLSDWSLAWHDWLQHPLTGWGPGSFADIHGELRSRPAWISNLSMRLLQETGIIGILTFVGFLSALILPAVKVSRLQTNSRDRAALLGLTIGYIVLIGIAYQSTDGIWIAASWVHAGLIAAGTIVLAPSKAQETSHSQPKPLHPTSLTDATPLKIG